ncbi:MAG: tetratricopeptide repeat protein [Caldilineaceae bacterium]
MPTFSELLSQYIQRTGITDAELARGIGVRRQTIFRWKEGIVERPRHRDDVLQLAKRLRLTAAERDELLIAAGFPPEEMPPPPAAPADSPAADDAVAPPEAPSISPPPTAAPTMPLADTTPYYTVQLDDAPLPSVPTTQPGRFKPPWRWALPALGILVVLGWALNAARLPDLLSAPTTTPAPATPPVLTLHAPTPPPTPTRYQVVAAEGETLLLVATFANYAGNAGFNVAGRIEEALDQQIAAAKLTNTKVVVLDAVIGNAAKAEAHLAAARAAMLLWGEYDSARVVVNFALRGDLENPSLRQDLLSMDELPTVINRDVPQQVRSLALFALGQLFRGDGQTEQARTVLENALKLEPSVELRSKIYFFLGSLHGNETEDDLSQAIDDYSEVIALRPADANALYNRGLAYWNRYQFYSDSIGDLDSAVKDFGQTIVIKPQFAPAYLSRGAAYYVRSDLNHSPQTDGQRSDIQRAVADFGRIIQLEPTNYDAYYNRGLAYIRTGNNTLWQADLEQAQQLAPPTRVGNILVALCWGYALAQEPQAALTHCQQARELDPNRGDTEDSLGLIYAQLGDFDQAIEHFNTYLTWLKAQPSAYYARYHGPIIEEWVAALTQGENPITAAALDELR